MIRVVALLFDNGEISVIKVPLGTDEQAAADRAKVVMFAGRSVKASTSFDAPNMVEANHMALGALGVD